MAFFSTVNCRVAKGSRAMILYDSPIMQDANFSSVADVMWIAYWELNLQVEPADKHKQTNLE